MQQRAKNLQRSNRTEAPRSWVRTGTLMGLAIVPLLAVALLGAGLLNLSGQVPGLPGGLMIQQTRAFNLNGQAVPAPQADSAAMPVEEFMTNWQNTVRTPPSPRI